MLHCRTAPVHGGDPAGCKHAGRQFRPNKTEANLKAVQDRIERVRQQVQRDAVEKDRLNRDLNAAEKSVAQARGDLTKVQQQRAERAAAREQLEKERTEREEQRSRTVQNLADQLRAAYFMGRNEPLKLLLNQKDPAQFGRNLTYYGYFGRLRANQISEINENIAKIDELKTDDRARRRRTGAAGRSEPGPDQ